MNKSYETQLKKYGGVGGYKAEMKRRRGLVKNYALQDNPKLARRAANKRWAKKNDTGNPPQTDDL